MREKVEVLVAPGAGFDASIAAVVERFLYDSVENGQIFQNGTCGFDKGCHFVFEMYFGLETMSAFTAELRIGDISDCYAAAKVRQLKAFQGISYTGGETIDNVRDMLRHLGYENAQSFYSEYKAYDPITSVNNRTGKWLRDEFGLAPWYGSAEIPFTLNTYGDGARSGCQSGAIYTGFSGCENDQEDLNYAFVMTKRILGIFASEWAKKSVLKLQLDGLRTSPVIGTTLRWLDIHETIMPSRTRD